MVRAWEVHLLTRGTSVERAAPPASSLAGCWAELRHRSRVGRVVAPLLAVATEAGQSLGPDERDQVRADHLAAMYGALRLDRALLEVHERLGRAGVPHLTLKGTSVAHLDYPDPSERQYGDIDILVPGNGLDVAVEVLEAAGFARLLPAAHPRVDAVLAKAITLRGDDGTEIDLHRTVTPGAFGLLIPLDRLWEGAVTLELGASRLLALGPVHRLLVTAAHLRLGNAVPRLSTVRDLIVQCDRLAVDDSVEEAEELGLAAVLGSAVLAVVGGGVPVPEPYATWARDHHPSDVEARRLAAHLAAEGSFRAQARAMLGELGWADRVTAARALVFPRRAHLRARGLSRAQHLRSLLPVTRRS